MMRSERPDAHTSLREYPYVVVRFRCHVCERGGDSRLAVLAHKFGPGTLIGALLRKFIAGCPWDPQNPGRKQQKYGHRCGAYMPDLTAPPPPDLPPALGGLTLIEGGKAGLLPAEPREIEKRRRVGVNDDV